MKGQSWEGGLRVPLIARWPDKIPKGHVSDEPCSIVDLFTTVLAAAGIPIPTDRPIDGKDIMPLLTGKAKSPHEAIYSMRGDALCTVRSDRWKLHGPAAGPREQTIMSSAERWSDPRAPDGFTILAPREQYHPSSFPGVATGDGTGDWLLFDLSKDPSEQHNVADKYPEVMKELRKHFDGLLAEMPEKSKAASLPKKKKEKSKAPPDKPASDDKKSPANTSAAGKNDDAAKKGKATPADE
jgi:arylsulfatase A-like enzyme